MRRNGWSIIFVMFFFILSTSSASIYAEKGYINDVGVFFDPLDDGSYIDTKLSEGYRLEKGCITINTSERSAFYDYNITPNKMEMYSRGNTILLSLPLIGLSLSPSLFDGPDLFIEYMVDDLSPLKEKEDYKTIRTESTWEYKIFVPLHHFKFYIIEKNVNISRIIFNWFGNSSGKYVEVFAWSYAEHGAWKKLGKIENLGGSLSINEGCKYFVGRSGRIDFLVIPVIPIKTLLSKGNNYLETDYVSLEIKGVERKKATIVTKNITAKSWMWWEFIEWNGSVPDDTSIRVYLLDKNGNLVSDDMLKGNSNGFTAKIIPISYLDTSTIRIKFVLETKNINVLPSLCDYMVAWQSESGKWFDDLTTKYRLERKEKKEIISKPIYLPKGYWWDEFYADVNLSGGGNVTFSILNEAGKVLIKNIWGKNETKYEITDISSKTIKIKAVIKGNKSFTPKINKWWIKFYVEREKPLLRYPSYIYIKKDDIENGKIDITISAKDNFPGICKDGARYKLYYVNDSTGKDKITDWFFANVDGKDFSKNWVNVTAKDVPIYSDNFRLDGIKFSVSDMVGNSNESDLIDIEMDMVPPVSSINTKEMKYKLNLSDLPVEISATADDDKTNIKRVTLYYMISFDNYTFSDPYEYSNLSKPPWVWEFTPSESGYYRFFTLAEDNAGNVEEKEGYELSLLVDIEKPNKPNFPNKIYWLNENKSEDAQINFRDNLCIYKIEYKINTPGFEWREIAENVNSSSYSWTLTLDRLEFQMMGEGKEYRVYFRITDLVGNIYETQRDEEGLRAIKDITPPSSSLESIKLWQSDKPIKLSAYVGDTESGVSKVVLMYRYSPDNKTWSEWKDYEEGSFSGWHTWTFDPIEGDGHYEIKMRVYDNAGNFADSEIISFGLTVLPKVEIISFVMAFLIFVLISAMIVKRWD